ncbi:16S rRNA (cytidine(1402)-2'-O)-methyltransferase [Pontixanthobacter aestiaquae]|uniref:Ribosomal RNA small subunit methyltransferase I n=1 Tax=Pontixanthobacter aestiaquae TaxID=1509367 RepID=A0A844Z6M9_9SPHN|nr:16S rRNA (cytidine(1402)-2'-O)-methyltransferase [Pontixanthobacter aestiaquae]MDN3645435.1 16S rRNA (cytidine(1402)-2'-O)-methyltransferase [Pontixanthobacter aestiaquae]MXO83565.1 16S rRNA (cytidine(1402)-2'-O)-methyltransferase [Pontixanthobacter aestiaquae]
MRFILAIPIPVVNEGPVPDSTTQTSSEEPPAEPLSPGLYIVATPIGNLGDITMRSVDVLHRCDGVACEDTRVTGKLLKHLGISKPLWRYNDHSEERDRARLVQSMKDRAVVLVSDAGTPLISDPGYRLVQDARAAGVSITSLPGACAAVVGLTLSGLPNDKFLFAGFLPSKEQARVRALDNVATIDATLVFYETGPRLTKSLQSIAAMLPRRTVSVARELTKMFEECRTDAPEALIAHYTQNPPKGEIVLMVGPPADYVASAGEVDELLREALNTEKASQAAGKVAKATGLDRKTLYARAMELRSE